VTRKDAIAPREVAPGVHRYGSRYVNCYLIEDGDRFTLLDTGLPSYVRNLRALLANLGRSIRDIDAVLLTHCHIDHMGAAKQVAFEANAFVHAHELDGPPLRGERRLPVPNIAKNLGQTFLLRYLFGHIIPNGGAKYPTIADLTTFADGDVVDVPGSPRVIHAPGHTTGSSALHLEERRVLFSGDALVTLDTLTGKTGPHVFAPPFSHDYGQAVASIDRLETLDADLMLPGHGEPWRGTPAEAVQEARRGALV
jgi:glyoxylase-like metal-dependent hydrolase (beta-lactamase superfamily II)